MADYGFDTTDLEKLIASLSRAQAPTDEDRSAARSQALQVAGLGLLGTPKGRVWGRAGQAGMNALAARQQYLSDIPKQRQAAIESAGKAMTLQEQLEALKERKQYEAGLRGGLLQAPGAEPTAGPTSIAPSMAQAFAAPPLPASATGVLNNPGGVLPGLPPVSQLSQAPAVPPSSIEPSAPAPAATGTDPYSVLMKQAMQAQNVYQTTGNRYAQKQAEHFFGLAEKWREKMELPEVGMVGGKPTLVRYGDYGGQQNVAGVEPTPDFATVDRGGSTDFVNKYTIPSTGQSFAKTETFADKLARQREAREAANVGRDDWVNDLDRGIQVNKKTGESRPIMAGGTPIGAKEDKATDPQLAARGFHLRMSDSSKIIDPLEKGGYTPGWGAGAAKTAGKVPLVGGLTGGVANVTGNFFSGDKMGEYEQAAAEWIRAKLRKESGAVIGDDEMAAEFKTYFPQPGDSDALKAQKAAARKTAEKAMAIQAKLKTDGGGKDVRSAADRILAGEN